VGRLGLDSLSIRAEEDRGHEAQRAEALSDHVRLHITCTRLVSFSPPKRNGQRSS
jgi:hypothetical protein